MSISGNRTSLVAPKDLAGSVPALSARFEPAGATQGPSPARTSANHVVLRDDPFQSAKVQGKETSSLEGIQ